MQKYERIGLWIIVAGLLIFGMTINSGLGSLQKTVNANSDKLAKSEVVASVIPGIPSALSDAWKAAAGTEDMSRADDLWLTVRLANRGYDLVGEVSAELSLVPEIADVFAYGAGGKTLGASWGGPKISEGGSGERMVAVDFRSVLPGGAHLLFVGLHPQGFEAPYGPDDRKEWVAVNKMYWNVLKVATTETAGSDGEKVTVQYGLGSAGQLKTGGPAVSQAEPEKGAG